MTPLVDFYVMVALAFAGSAVSYGDEIVFVGDVITARQLHHPNAATMEDVCSYIRLGDTATAP